MSTTSVSTSVLSINKWVRDLENIDINTLHPKIQCKFLMAIEDSVYFTKLIKMMQFYSGILTAARLITISLSDIYEFLKHSRSSHPYWDSNFVEIVTAASNDAFIYVHMEKQIPVDLLIKLIKLKIISVIKEIIFLQRKETILCQQKNFYKPLVLERDNKSKNKAKGKQNKAKSKDRSEKLTKTKKGKKDEDITIPCENYNYNLPEEILPDENLDIPGAFIYIVLVGFYNSNLIPFCHWHGIPLTCVIKYGEANIKFSKFSSQTSLDSINFIDEVLISPNKYLPMSQLYKTKEYIISNFWQKVNIMYKTEKSPYIDDSFIMIYTPRLFVVAKRNSKLYFHQCEQLYEDFLEFVQKLEDYQRQYNTYLENLEVYKLDTEPKKVEIQQLQLYQNALDSLPIDVISVSLILDNLINEICNECEATGDSNNKKSTLNVTDERNLSKQSCHLAEEDLVCHRSLRDQLKKIFAHFKFAGSTCLTTSVPLSNKFTGINNKPYIIHESNFIEMTLNYYKYLPNTILDTIVTYLKKSPCINTFINFPPLNDFAVARNKAEIREWCTLLDIDELDLYICLNTILIGMFVLPEEADLTRDTPNWSQYIPTEKITHEIQASIPKESKKIVRSTNQINPYQKLNPFDMKWVDRLPCLVTLQELAKATEEYEAVDRKYVELFDSMVFRFHHDVDEFGIVTKFWKKDIRTHVNFHDFMTYIFHRDFDVITEQNENFEKEEILLKCVQDSIENLGDFNVCSEDFILPGSLKDKYLHKMPSEIILDTQDKGKKSNKPKAEKKSTLNKSTKSTKSAATKVSKVTKKDDTIDVRAVVENEPLKIDVEGLNLDRNLLPHHPPNKLNAIDFDGLLLTCSGISTSFYSLDDFKIIVDQIQMCDRKPTLSIKVGLNHHDLIVHRTSKGGFSFLVNFKSGAVLACCKSTLQLSETDTNFYLMREESENIISCMRSLFNTKKSIIITEKKFKEIVKPKKQDLKKEFDIKSVNSVPVSQKSNRKESRGSLSNGRRSSHKPTSSQSLIRSRRGNESKTSMNETASFSVKGFVNEIKLLKKMFTTLMPKFKVCSSKLHQYDFIKRIVSPIELNLNEIIRFVMRGKRENKRLLTVKKRYNVKSKPKHVKQVYEYDFRITLPSGLHLRNIVGEQGPCLCQYYFQKQIVCVPIRDEDCRLFLGKGIIAVKKNNGQIVIYAANGEIIKYETLLAESSYGNSKVKRNIDCPKTMFRFIKHVRKNIFKLTKGCKGTENVMSSRRSGKREVKKFKCINQRHAFSNIKFSFTTSEGKIFLYKNGSLKECEAYYVEKEDVLKSGQVIFYREDGTTSILTDEGHMQTIFTDGTKITVWCEFDAKPVTIDLRDQFGPDCEDMGSFVKVITCYQYEHPYYITILTSGADDKIMLRIASGEIFDISSTYFLVGIDESSTLLANKEIVRFVGTPCTECGKYCECDVYINQLYNPPLNLDSEQLLLKAFDTCEKSFLVHYDGSIERNDKYINERRCNHASHKIQPSQAFFSLNRDFSGCMFWTDDDYNKRLAEEKDPATDYVVFYVDKKTQKILTTEWKTFVKQHHNFRFIWPKLETDSNDIDEYDISSAAFVKQRIVKKISKNVIANLISIINQRIDILPASFKKVLNIKSSSTESLSFESTEEFKNAQRAHTKRKLAYEKKMNKRNMECMSVIDKIIEYFVTKTGRYYRSKVYEDFCGVKLMLDDEEEIFFLANFDNSTHTVSSEDISDLSADLSKTQNLSPSSELIKSKLCKSTSAVDIALEVIKQIELENQTGKIKTKALYNLT